MSGQLQSNAVSDVMSFSPLLKRLFSLVLLLLAAVKHKRFATDERGCGQHLRARFIKLKRAAFGGLRTADKHASDKNQDASQAYLQCCRHCRSVHVAMPNPGNCRKLDQHHAEGDNHRYAKSGDQKGQGMTKSAERRHRTTDRAAKPGMSSSSQRAVIRECL